LFALNVANYSPSVTKAAEESDLDLCSAKTSPSLARHGEATWSSLHTECLVYNA